MCFKSAFIKTKIFEIIFFARVKKNMLRQSIPDHSQQKVRSIQRLDDQKM